MSVWSLTYQQSVFKRCHSDKQLSEFYLQDGGKIQLAQTWNKITSTSPHVWITVRTWWRRRLIGDTDRSRDLSPQPPTPNAIRHGENTAALPSFSATAAVPDSALPARGEPAAILTSAAAKCQHSLTTSLSASATSRTIDKPRFRRLPRTRARSH